MRYLGNASVQFSCTFTLVKIVGGIRYGWRQENQLSMIFKKFKVTKRRNVYGKVTDTLMSPSPFKSRSLTVDILFMYCSLKDFLFKAGHSTRRCCRVPSGRASSSSGESEA